MMDDDNSNELYLSMMASVETEGYDIFMSFDNGDFEKVAEAEEYEYIYNIESECSHVEIYAVAYGLNDEAMETNHIFVELVDRVYTGVLPDTDGDG